MNDYVSTGGGMGSGHRVQELFLGAIGVWCAILDWRISSLERSLFLEWEYGVNWNTTRMEAENKKLR